MNFSSGFFKGQRLRWLKREYVVEKRLGNQHIELKDVLSGVSIVEKDEVLAERFFTGDLIYLDQIEGKAASEVRNTRILEANFADLPDVERHKAKRRLAYVKALLIADLNKIVPETVLPIIAKTAIETKDPHPPSFSSVWRWHKKYLKSSGNIRSLADNTLGMGNCACKMQPEVERIVNQAIRQVYLTTKQNIGADVYTRIEVSIIQENRSRKHLNSSNPAGEPLEILKVPSKTTLYHHLRKLDPYERDRARLGERLANLKYNAYNKGPRPSRALQRMELDHTFLPVILVDTEQWLPIGRPVMTLAFDKLTDCPLGWYVGFEAPGYTSVAKCIKHAIRPKSYVRELYPSVQNTWNAYGIPETAFCDDGPDFWSDDLEKACLQLGTTLEYAPSRHPWWKASIERHFLTIKTELVHRLPGAELTKLLGRVEYDPRKDAILSFSSFMEIIHIWLIDIYMQTPRRGRTTTPALAWDRAIEAYPPRLPQNPRDLDIFLFKHEERYLQGRGIEYEGLIYTSTELMGLRRIVQQMPHRPKVKIKIDPDDISCIYVQNPKSKSYVVAPAVEQAYTKGLTLWHHKIIKENARLDHKGAVNIEALCQARERINAIVRDEWLAGTAKQSRKLSHRWLSGPSLNPSIQFSEARDQNADSDDCKDEQIIVCNSVSQTWAGVSELDNALPPSQPNEHLPKQFALENIRESESVAASIDGKSNHPVPETQAQEIDIRDQADRAENDLDCAGWTSSKRKPRV